MPTGRPNAKRFAAYRRNMVNGGQKAKLNQVRRTVKITLAPVSFDHSDPEE
jgi:hypothetical protein